MKRFHITAGKLFQSTVFLLGIPSVLLLVIIIFSVSISLLIGPTGGGIGSFSFGISLRELRAGAAIIIGIFLLLCFLGSALIRRHKRRNAEFNR